MSAFSDKDFDANGYSSSRPTYPPSFYNLLKQYHNKHEDENYNQRVLDIGCGPGTATFQMVHLLNEGNLATKPQFNEFVGSDISPVMIQQAKVDQDSLKQPNINMKFEVGSYDSIGKDGSLGKFDLITAVECVHWFDFETFQSHAYDNLLVPGGTIAIWGYADAILVDYPDTDGITYDLAYADDQMGPYWQQPGRNRLRSMLKDDHFDPKRFTDIKESQFDARDLRKNGNVIPGDILDVCKRCTLSQYEGYLKTFSAYHSWKQDIKNQGKPDPCEVYIDELIKRHPELTRDTKIELCWNTFYKFATRRE
ncbi:trans-aconitate 3-methyltransferase [Monosporozyma unispora]|nr:hypothetical protein C6P44_001864 [Kazachstania unispora]